MLFRFYGLKSTFPSESVKSRFDSMIQKEMIVFWMLTQFHSVFRYSIILRVGTVTNLLLVPTALVQPFYEHLCSLLALASTCYLLTILNSRDVNQKPKIRISNFINGFEKKQNFPFNFRYSKIL